MTGQSDTPRKDTWDRFQIVAQVAIAIIAFLFTVLFTVKQQRNADATLELASSNLDLAKAQKKISEEQLKSALLPSLASDNPKQRTMALHLARTLDESFATAMASVIAVSDPDPQVRQSARVTLGALSQSQETEVRQRVEKSIAAYDVVNEMRTKGLLKRLSDAQGYLEGGNAQDKEKALQIYGDVVSQLSSAGRGKLDQQLLGEAERDYKEGHNDDAIRKYRALFAGYRQASLEK